MQKKIYNLLLVSTGKDTNNVSVLASFNDLKKCRFAEISSLLRDSVAEFLDDEFGDCWQCGPADLPKIAESLKPGETGCRIWAYSEYDDFVTEAVIVATMLDIDIYHDTDTICATLVDLFARNGVRKIVCGLHEGSESVSDFAPSVISYDDDDNAFYRDLESIELKKNGAGKHYLSLETSGRTPAGYICRDEWGWFAAPFSIETLYSYCEALINNGELTEEEKPTRN